MQVFSSKIESGTGRLHSNNPAISKDCFRARRDLPRIGRTRLQGLQLPRSGLPGQNDVRLPVTRPEPRLASNQTGNDAVAVDFSLYRSS